VLGLDGPWDGRPAPFLERSFDLWRGPTVEIWCAPGDPARLVVRAAHAVTDGRGLSLFVRSLVQALNGVDPDPVPGGPVTDAALARGAPIVEGAPAVPVVAPTGAPSGDAPGAVWSRVSVPGRGADRPLARLLVALARARPGALVHVDVPVDLRRFGSGPSTANLAGWLRVDATALLDDPDPVGAAAALVRARAGTGEAFAPVRLAHALRWVPLALMVREGRRRSAQERAAGAWPVSATASWLGRTPAAERSWPGFTAERTWWVPPGSAGLPLLTILSGTEHSLDLTACAPAPLATEGRLDALLAELAQALA
jgi:hypothetical protein